MSDQNVGQQKTQQQQNQPSNSAILQEIKGLVAMVSKLEERVDMLEVSGGKNDKAVDMPDRTKNYNDDAGPYAKPVYDKTCLECKRAFKTLNASVLVCSDCLLKKQQSDAARVSEFNKQE